METKTNMNNIFCYNCNEKIDYTIDEKGHYKTKGCKCGSNVLYTLD